MLQENRLSLSNLLGKIAVVEYIHQFMRLSWFTQVLIDTEAMKVDINSLGGLRPSIHKDVTAMIHPATYDEAVSRAYWFEENQTIQQSETKSKE